MELDGRKPFPIHHGESTDLLTASRVIETHATGFCTSHD